MTAELPEYYFRVRKNGAVVFRVDTQNRQSRIEMEQIAVVTIRNGKIKPQGDRVLTPAELTAIDVWVRDRNAVLAQRDIDEIRSTVDHLNLATHWAQSSANDAQLDQITDDLLLAMHDLRTVLVRKKAERLTQEH